LTPTGRLEKQTHAPQQSAPGITARLARLLLFRTEDLKNHNTEAEKLEADLNGFAWFIGGRTARE
jgi:hypothetical protein